MNLCEKNGVAANVYSGFCPLKKGANFQGVKKLFGIIPLTYVTIMVDFTHDKEKEHIG